MAQDVDPISGKVVIVTGASSGIGAAAARALVARGARVVAVSRSTEDLARIGADSPGGLLVQAADVRSLAEMERVAASALEEFGRIDAVIANAGVGEYAEFLETSPETVEEIIDTNLLGTVWSIRAALPHLLVQGGDVIVVSSVAAVMDPPGEAVYAASKAAQKSLAAALDAEVRRRGVRVTTLLPGGVRTAFAIGRGREEGSSEFDTMLAPEDVADAILTVLSQPRTVRTTVWGLSHPDED